MEIIDNLLECGHYKDLELRFPQTANGKQQKLPRDHAYTKFIASCFQFLGKIE